MDNFLVEGNAAFSNYCQNMTEYIFDGFRQGDTVRLKGGADIMTIEIFSGTDAAECVWIVDGIEKRGYYYLKSLQHVPPDAIARFRKSLDRRKDSLAGLGLRLWVETIFSGMTALAAIFAAYQLNSIQAKLNDVGNVEVKSAINKE